MAFTKPFFTAKLLANRSSDFLHHTSVHIPPEGNVAEEGINLSGVLSSRNHNEFIARSSLSVPDTFSLFAAFFKLIQLNGVNCPAKRPIKE